MSNLPIEGILYKDDPLNPTEKRILHPATSAKQVSFGAGSIVDVLPTPAQKITLNNLVPTEAGILQLFGGEVLPKSYLWANGEYYFKTEKESLFGVLGTKYGENEDKKKFAVPKISPVHVQGFGNDYIPISFPELAGESSVIDTVLYCDDPNGNPYLYLVQGGATGTVASTFNLKTKTVTRASIANNSSTYYHYCKFDRKIYSRSGTTGIYRSSPLDPNPEKLTFTPPTGLSGFCVDTINGDIYMLATISGTGKGFWKWTRSTETLELLSEFDSLCKPTGSASGFRDMLFDHENSIIYTSANNFLIDTAAATYRMMTYDLVSNEINIGDISTGTYIQNIFHTCGKVYCSTNPSIPFVEVDKLGKFHTVNTVLPLQVPTANTTQCLDFDPTGIPYWMSANGPISLRSYRLGDTAVGRSLYHIIKE